jgi:uncharacterized SAM-binding protein YcdF (DUF218 family)
MGSVSGRHTRNWQRHLFYKRESIRTTWKLRLALLGGLVLIVSATRAFWIPGIGRSLVCDEERGSGDAILVENFDVSYRVFERAATLQRAGFSGRILVPTQASSDPEQPNLVSKDIVEIMTQVARLQHAEIIPIQGIEPISLNAAYQIRDFLTKQNIRSVVVVTPGFRSRRSALVYQAVLGESGIRVSCVPVFGGQVENWSKSWHGIEDVTMQLLKLWYYRLYVLPFVLSKHVQVTL